MKMKTISICVIAVILFLGIGCKKDPKGVVLSSDQTTVTKGQKVLLILKWDSKAKWIEINKKVPNSTTFTLDTGTSVQLMQRAAIIHKTGSSYGHQLRLDSVGVYTFNSTVYACSSSRKNNCKGQTKSNEISITVTP